MHIKVKRLRKSLQLTQAELGNLLNVNQSRVSLIEHNKSIPSHQMMLVLQKLAAKHKLRIKFV
jgi:transcriptional regulator with XRE-family HTH domain